MQGFERSEPGYIRIGEVRGRFADHEAFERAFVRIY